MLGVKQVLRVSFHSHPPEQLDEFGLMIPRQTKLDFVGSLSLSNHQAKRDTFRGTNLFKIKSKGKIVC